MDTDDTSPFKPGDRFGDYTVERLLGKGSMGVVYLMRSSDGTPFAVKIMHRGAMSHDLRVRFAREADFAMKIRHRNLVSVYDVGEDPDTGLCYIIMDYVPGGTLADRISERGALAIDEAVKIVMHIAAALDVAHKNGLVHRDVKPDNIMFAADGTPKLTDLGVAKFGGERETMVTMSGMMIGTPAYMSPEQLIDSHNIDARSDIYSLGVVLYEMLSGKRPNSGSTSVELLAKAIKGEPLPDIRTMCPEISAAVAHVISLMCALVPEARPASSVEAANLLLKAAAGKLVLPRKPPRAADVESRKTRRHFPVVAIAVGAFIIAAAAIFGWRAHHGNRQQAVTIAPTTPSASSVAATVSDGKLVEVFPRLDRSPKAWAYSFEKEQGWENPDFDDSGWKCAQGGFGSRREMHQLPRARVNTTWNSERIFLRRRFIWSGGNVSRVVLDAYYDDDVEIYLNGVFVFSVKEACRNWRPLDIPAARFARALKPGKNVFCAEAKNRSSCQYFDCGLLIERGDRIDCLAVKDGTRKVTTDAGTWTVVVKDGIAQIGDGHNVALDPPPKGHLDIPSELDGLPIRKLARDCFKSCDALESVTIQEGVRSIEQGAFFLCRSLSEVSLPASLEYLAGGPFHESQIAQIDLRNVRLMAMDALRGCGKLERVHIASDNRTYSEADGVVYDKIRNAVVFCPRSRSSYEFPAGIEEVCDYAFQRCMIVNAEIPASVKVVGHSAFSECPLLESVKFDGADAVLHDWSFGNNPRLKSIVLPSRLKSLDANAIFSGSGLLTSMTLPDTVEVIGARVFESCPCLKTINLGKSLRVARFRAFAKCPALDEISFPKTLEELTSSMFLNCQSLRRVFFAGNAPTLVGSGKNLPGQYVYKNTDRSLVSYVPKGSTGWSGKSSNLPERWPVHGGDTARAIAYSDSVSAVARQAAVAETWRSGPSPRWFVEWDKALAEAKKTGKKIFVLNTGSDWCHWCKKLKEEVLDKPEFKAFADKNLVLLYLDSPRRKPLGKAQKMHNREVVKALGFGGGVPNVEIFTHDGKRLGAISGGGQKVDDYLDRAKKILAEKGEPVRSDEGKMLFNEGYGTLAAKIAAERAKLPPVTKDDFKAKGKTVVAVETAADGTATPRIFNANGYDWRYSIDKDGKALLVGDEKSPCISPRPVGKVVVPAEVNGHKVVAIGHLAFHDCPDMTAIEIPEGLESIRGWYVFARCRGLTEVTLPKSMRRIGTWVFESCTNLRRVNLMNCEHADNGFGCNFIECYALEEILCSKNNKAIVSVNGVLYTKDRKSLLAYPKARGELKVLSGVSEIANSALVSLPMTRVKIPEGIVRVDGFNFEYDRKGMVKEVVFPESLMAIGDYMFKKTTSVDKVVFCGDAPRLIAGSPFMDTDADIVVEVPKGSTGWNGPGSSDLPERWPVGAGEDSRRIRYGGETYRGGAPAPYVSKSKLHASYRSKDRKRVFVEVCHAHCHSSFISPPFTVERVREAISSKADILHFVLCRSNDGVLFSAERERLENVSDGVGSVGDYTAKQFKRFKVKQNGDITTRGFATFEDMLRVGKGKILFEISGAWDYAEDLEKLLNRLDAWESVIVEAWDVREAQKRYGPRMWKKLRSGELQLITGAGCLNDWKDIVPEVSVWGWHVDLAAHGLAGVSQRIDVGFTYGPGDACRTDDEAGWEKALKDGATVFRTNRPVELGKFLKKRRRWR